MDNLVWQLQFSPTAQTAVLTYLTAEFSPHNMEAGLDQNTEFEPQAYSEIRIS